jgi:hypothetical protein
LYLFLKKRKKVVYGSLRKYLGDILYELEKQKGIEILEGHLMRNVFKSSAKNSGIKRSGLFEREECNSHCQEI